MKTKRIISALLSTLTVLTFSACGSSDGNASSREISPGSHKVKVSVTFDAMAEFTKAVGKDKVDVSTIIPDGTEPHDFEPKAKDLAGLSNAQVFVYSGLGMEAWAEKAVGAAGNKNLVAVEASKGVEAIRSTDAGEIQEHGQYDPHIWLSLKGAETEAQNIRDALCKADPPDADSYRKNCAGFVSQLESLFSEYNAKFHSEKSRSFVTGHAAFAYLCRDFGLTQNSVEDVFAEGEPSAQRLTELITYCKENHVKTVFVEDMVSPEISQTLAREVGAKVEKIYTMESTEDGKNYLDRMKSNLQEIDESLKQG